MTLLAVDQEKCRRDGICTTVCPVGIITQKSEQDFPQLIEGGEELCIHCGHCVAVCPHTAMSHQSVPAADCPPVNKDWLLSPEQAEHFLRNRRSIRVYKDKAVPREVLARLIKIARHAPSGHNRQPVKWLVVYSAEDVQRLAGMVIDWMRHLIKEQSPLVAMLHLKRVVAGWEAGIDPVNRNAPHLIIAHGDKEDSTVQTSGTIALTYLELITTAFGLGACWAGFFHAAALFWPPLQKTLKLAEDQIICGAMMVGYPRFKYHRQPVRKEPEISWR